MKCYGDVTVVRTAEYRGRLSAQVTGLSGSSVLTSPNWGQFLVITPSGSSQTITLPTGSDTGQFVESAIDGWRQMAVVAAGGDSIIGSPEASESTHGRTKAMNVAANQWAYFGRRYQSENSTSTYARVVATYTDSNLQTPAASLGDPPTWGSLSLLDLSTGMASVDTNSIYSAGAKTFTVPDSGWYEVDVSASFFGTGTSNARLFLGIGKNGVQQILRAATIPVAGCETVPLRHLLRCASGDVITIRIGTHDAETVGLRGFSIGVRHVASAAGTRGTETTEDVDLHYSYQTDNSSGSVNPADFTHVSFSYGSRISLNTGTYVWTLTPAPSGQAFLVEYGIVFRGVTSWTDATCRHQWRSSGPTYHGGKFAADWAGAGGKMNQGPDMALLVAPVASTTYDIYRVSATHFSKYWERGGCLVRRIK